MTKAKPAAEAIRPEQYHLDEAPKLRAAWREQAAQLDKKAISMREAAFRSAIAKHGVRIPKDAKIAVGRYNDGTLTLTFGKVSVRHTSGEFNRGSDKAPPAIKKVETEAYELTRRAQHLCKIITTTAARQFGSFCRTKYGSKPDIKTIRRAHGEWLDLQLNCKC